MFADKTRPIFILQILTVFILSVLVTVLWSPLGLLGLFFMPDVPILQTTEEEEEETDTEAVGEYGSAGMGFTSDLKS